MDNAIILAESVFGSTYGKTANGLVRFSKRYNIKAVIDSEKAGQDAGEILSGKKSGIPVVKSFKEASQYNSNTLIVGIATDGGVLPEKYRPYIIAALRSGMNVVSGLHTFLSDDEEFLNLAKKHSSSITDVRKMFRDRKDIFTGRVKEVQSRKIAVLGTDSACGKRTTAIFLSNAMERIGIRSELIGTGQTSWMQGFRYTIVLDAMINDFISGALESIAVQAWEEEHPEFMYLEGQGSVIHPAYPGSYEIVGALHPEAIVLQVAPKRVFYDGFDGFAIPPIEKYIKILELMSERKVIALAINKESMSAGELHEFIDSSERKYGIPAFDPLSNLDDTVSYIRDTVKG